MSQWIRVTYPNLSLTGAFICAVEVSKMKMDTVRFHDGELEQFIWQTTADNITESQLLTQFKEEITSDDAIKSSNISHWKLRDYLENNGLHSENGTGDSIQGRLHSKLGHSLDNESVPQHSGIVSDGNIHGQSSFGKRYSLKLLRMTHKQYWGPSEGPILSTKKRKFLTDCKAH